MGFLNGILLLGASLAILPILIHLLNKQRHRPVPWAAVDFLVQALERESRRLRVREIVLMTIRALAVICLAVALARPTVAGKVGLRGARRTTAAVILLDNSLSMSYDNGHETRFDSAKRLVRTILGQLDKGSWCALYTFSDDVRAPFGEPTRNLHYIEQELDSAVLPSDGGTHPEFAFERALSLMSDHLEFQGADREVYIVTDMQSEAWRGKQASFGRLLESLSERADVYLVDAGDPGRENVAVVGLRASEAQASVDMPVTLTAEVRNYGYAKQTGLTVDFFVDAKPGKKQNATHRTTVDLAPGQATRVHCVTRFRTGGDHWVEVRLGDDRLQTDNRRYLTVDVVDEAHVLLVDGRNRRADDPLAGEAGFLRHALTPINRDGKNGHHTILAEVTPADRLAERNLSQYHAVALCNVSSLKRPVLEKLREQVRSGMGLLVFLGDNVAPTRYHGSLGLGTSGLLPASIGEAWGKAPKPGTTARPMYKTFAVGLNNLAHPVMSFFKDEEARPLLTDISVFRAFSLRPETESGSTVIARFDDGRPAVVEKPYGTGFVVLFGFPATSLDFGGWSNFPTQFAFPIIMRRVMTRLAVGHRPPKNLIVGTPIVGDLDPADQRTPVRISAPTPIGNRVALPEAAGDGRARFEFGLTDKGLTYKAGFYEVVLDRPGASPTIYSLNSVANESDLTRVTPDEIRVAHPNFDFRWVSKSADFPDLLDRERRGMELWPWFIVLVFTLLILESTLAFRWGKSEA